MIGNLITILVLIALVVLFAWLARRAWRARNAIVKWVGVVLAGLEKPRPAAMPSGNAITTAIRPRTITNTR